MTKSGCHSRSGTSGRLTAEELSSLFSDGRFTDPARQFHARWVYAKDKTFVDAGLDLLRRHEPDVFAVYLQGTDVVSHYYWGYQRDFGYSVSEQDHRMYGRVVRNYYRYVDRAIGRYLDEVGEDTAVLIVSDHGFETKPVGSVAVARPLQDVLESTRYACRPKR